MKPFYRNPGNVNTHGGATNDSGGVRRHAAQQSDEKTHYNDYTTTETSIPLLRSGLQGNITTGARMKIEPTACIFRKAVGTMLNSRKATVTQQTEYWKWRS